MKNEKIKILGISVAGIIIILCFMQALNIQPSALGNLNDNTVPIKINQFPGFDESNSLSSDIMTFDSYQELTDFLTRKDTLNQNYYTNDKTRITFDVTLAESDMAAPIAIKESAGGSGSVDFSETNIQVEGVDEPDIVKTDGVFLYVVANNKVYIIKATPAEESKILGTIEVDSSLTIQNIFINNDKLVVFSSDRSYSIFIDHPIILSQDSVVMNSSVIGLPNPRWYNSLDTYLQVYDISIKEKPELKQEIVTPGSFTGARMIENHVYLITVQNSNTIRTLKDNETIVPSIMVNGKLQEISLSNIQYVEIPEQRQTITNIVSIDLEDEEKVEVKMFLLGNSQTLYVSKNNIYVVYSFRNYNYEMLKNAVEETLYSILPRSLIDEIEQVKNFKNINENQKKTVTEWMIKNFTQSLSREERLELYEEINYRFERTVIHKIRIENGDIEYQTKGEIPGGVKNQFSLSEHNGNLRVSSTREGMWLPFLNTRMQKLNNVYVLDEKLDVIGSVEGLAPGEDIYATRFVGDMCYLVTFVQIDPFFVIDLSDPRNPEVLGELKIPGFSTYLHPYDENHIIGVGREGRNIKISLFDVTNFSDPQEIHNYQIEETGSRRSWGQSSALDEHKAFLFDREKNLLIIPSGTYSKQSAYVFNITPEDGIKLRGTITHEPIDESNHTTNVYTTNRAYSVKRTLYIDNVLYTISNKMIKMNSLEDLSEINSIELK